MTIATLGAENQRHPFRHSVTDPKHFLRGLDVDSGRPPWALVFVPHLLDPGCQRAADDSDEADIERLRAEARILGVTLLVVAPNAVQCFQSDDQFRFLKAPQDVDGRQLAELFREFGVAAPAMPSAASVWAAFVLDARAQVRFAFRPPPEIASAPKPPLPTCHGTLLRALVTASKAFERKRLAGGAFIEQTTRALVAGFEEAFGANRASFLRWQPGLTLGTG